MRRSKSCNARATTKDFEGDEVYVTKFASHTHPPDHEETKAEEVMRRIKRKAEDNPVAGPSGIIRDELRDLPSAVLIRLSERRNMKKAVRRLRRANLPANPKRITDLGELPERFLIHDNGEANSRILVFGTRRNLEVLARSSRWYLDRIFKVRH